MSTRGEVEQSALALLRALGEHALESALGYAAYLEQQGDRSEAARWTAVADHIRLAQANGSGWSAR